MRPPAENLRLALAGFAAEGLTLLATSRFFATPCFPAGAGPDYVNAAAVIAVPPGTDARGVLDALHRIEARFGRTRDTRWGMRTLDLDLIALDDLVLPDPATLRGWQDLDPAEQALRAPDQLILPHPRLRDRAFVLIPMADVAPDWRHPLTGASVAQMVAALPAEARDEVRPIATD
jgi:2-amino-4-hydroxy-6-hydroxymethyldihydropteridine diphosphokinase